MKATLWRALMLVCAGIAPSACAVSSTPTHYYILTPGASSAAPQGAAAAPGPSVELDQVALPEYLTQPAIVTRSKTNEVERAEYDHWAGSLGDDVTRTLGQNLALALPTERLSITGTRGASQSDFTVEVAIESFERDPAGSVTLVARWSVFKADGRTALAMRRTSYRQNVDGQDYEGTVAAMSRALADLGRDIAGAIRGAPTPGVGTQAHRGRA